MFLTKVSLKVNQLSATYYLSFPKQVECNICGWQGKHFLRDDWHRNVKCPKCKSGVRHRLLFATISQIDKFSYKNIVQGKRILHFAAEPMLRSWLKKYANTYITADFIREGFDRKLDISDMSSISNGEFDLLIACDVLEHVPNHIKAIQEIYRVLNSNGIAIFTVPQKDNLTTTLEDPNIVDPEERERIFGQWDHLRIYGDDFPSILEKTGFKVTVVDQSNFTDTLIKKHILFPSILSENPLATNYRKIFFAQK